MLMNRALLIRMVKTKKVDTPPATELKPYQDPELMNAIAKDFVRDTAKVVVGVLAASFVLTVAEKLIINSIESD